MRDVTALIPAAGLGTRMVPATKETPKEMLPVPFEDDGGLVFKPFIQLVYESLYTAGVRTFVVVVGRGKRILQDHFVVDWGLHETLVRKGKKREAAWLERFYSMVEDSTIIWVDQPEPRGLGDAVLRGLRAVSTPHVLIHLGDILLHRPGHNPVRDLLGALECPECPGTIGLISVDDPRSYGVAIPGDPVGCEARGSLGGLFRVKGLVEKPREPPSRYAITGVYVLPARPLEEALLETGRNPSTGELELTDALQLLAERTGLCGAIVEGVSYLDIGRPERYLWTIRMLAGDRC